MIREAREETGIDVEITGLAGATEFEMPAVRVVLVCLEARAVGGELKLSEEHDAAAWVPWAEFSGYDLTEHARPFMIEYSLRKGAHEHIAES